MATLGQNYLGIIEMLKARDPDGTAATVVELLAANNAILDDAIAVECNDGTKHRHTIRTGLPSVSWGALYQGIPQSKSSTQQVEDTTGFCEGLSTVDERLLKLYPGLEAQVRMNEGMSFIESLNQEMATGIFYHDTATSPEKFKGLSARYSTLGGGGAGNNIIDAGGTGSDNTSIWFVTWGEMYTHLLYPKGSMAGIDREDMGRQRVEDGNGNPYYVQEEKFSWHIGAAVRDWRFNCRIANIDVSDLAAGSVDIYKWMRKAYYKGKFSSRRRIASGGQTPPVSQAIYCNADVMEALDAAAHNNGSSDNFTRLRPMEIEGKEVLTYRGIPVRECEAILNTEARVV
ncbi:MAG: hypothetical protein VX529_08090 [Pseudomonadota bacterium]|nr:hypothetical protein [Pseudomonadota bacterium]